MDPGGQAQGCPVGCGTLPRMQVCILGEVSYIDGQQMKTGNASFMAPSLVFHDAGRIRDSPRKSVAFDECAHEVFPAQEGVLRGR